MKYGKIILQLVLVHHNIVKNEYKLDSGALYTFVSDKSFCQLKNFKKIYLLETFNSDF